DHAAAPEAALVQARLTQVRTAARSRDATLAQYREALKAKEWERAWQLGSTLVRNHPDLLQGGQVTLPLVIESLPTGAAVSLDGKAIGTTPMVHAQIPGVAGELRVALPGYRPNVRSTSEAANDWRWRVELLREPVWTLELGHGVGLLHPIPGGFFVHSAETVQMVGRDGRPGWKFRATAGDDLIEGARVRLAHPPIELGDGRIAFGLSDHNLVILDAAGSLVREIRTESAVRGRPQTYANEILGGGRRLAFGAEQLQVGPLDGALTAIDVGSPVLSGPLAYANDLDRLMVTATLDGKLVGSEESTHKRLWSIDLLATDVAQLVPLGRDALVCVLDGSRIACYQAGPTGAAERWRAKLDEPAIGNPVIAADGSVLLAAGARILRFRPDGTPLPPLQLPSPVTGSIALDGDILAVGSKGHLSVFRAGQLAWSTVLPAPVTAVAVTTGLVAAGLADGKLLAFSP
nr:PQQ-binding-like beta-propeller repeat protein [Planctomycetota bacterium]